MTSPDLPAALEQTARALPLRQAQALADALAAHPAPSPGVRARLLGLVPTPIFSSVAGRLMDAWEAQEERVAGTALALALRASAQAAASTRKEQRVEVVWTGPITSEVPVRLTRAVLIDVIRAARAQLHIVSFAAYKVQVLLDELGEAAARGVDVRLVLETALDSGGSLTFDAAGAFRSLGDTASFYVWPLEKRPTLQAGHASLHAKAAIADDQVALVTSANLTGHGIGENMELGLLVRGGPVPRQLASHFGQLIRDGVLMRIPIRSATR